MGRRCETVWLSQGMGRNDRVVDPMCRRDSSTHWGFPKMGWPWPATEVPPEVIWLIACGCQRKHYYPRDTLASWQMVDLVRYSLSIATSCHFLKWALGAAYWMSHSSSIIRHWLETPVNRPLFLCFFFPRF